MLLRTTVAIVTTCMVLWASRVGAHEPSWTGPVIVRGPERVAIQSMDVLDRPYRPFHFYGNTVRRAYYRGQVLPTPRDVAQALKVLATAR